MVLVSERLQDFDFDLTLLMKFLPVLQNLDCYKLLGLVIKALEYHTKGSSSKFLLNLISEEDLILGLIEIVSLLVTETIVKNTRGGDILLWILIKVVDFILVVLSMALVVGVEVDVVDWVLVVKSFITFKSTQHLTIVSDQIFWCHWEHVLAG